MTQQRNFNPQIWGKGTWDLIHLVAMSYPSTPSNRDKQNYRNFYVGLGDVLPCAKCRKNYRDHCLRHNIDQFLSNDQDLIEWTVRIRNCVERNIGRNPKFSSRGIQSYYNRLQSAASKSVWNPLNLQSGPLMICAGAALAVTGIFLS